MKILVDRPLMRLPDGGVETFARSDASLYALDWDEPLDVFQRIGGDDYGNRNASCTMKRNRTREVFLAGDYDALLCFDSDIIAPTDSLKRLVALDADIAYGLYVNRPFPHQWCAAVMLQEQRWQSLSSLPDTARELWGEVIDVCGVGFGFTLIKRHILEAAPFRDWTNVSCDWGLSYDAQQNGWSQVMDLGCVLGHIKRDGAVLWPDRDALVRTEAY